MCTVTWRAGDGEYDLFANRDELRSRGRALPPRLHEAGSVRFLAPIDPDGGGTWVAVNDRGLGLTLLNDFSATPRVLPTNEDFESRGLLVTRMAAEVSSDDVAHRLRSMSLDPYRPFRLVVVALDVGGSVHHWDGQRLAEETPSEPALVCSSSYDFPAVARARRKRLLEVAGPRPDRGGLETFHRDHRPERGPLSPCMHRDEAATVSFTVVSVANGQARMRYHDGSPCTSSAVVEVELELTSDPAAGA